MKSDATCIVIATGGSGGHVIPSETLSRKLEKHGARCVMMGHQIEKNPYISQGSHSKKIDIESAPMRIKSMHRFILSNLKGTVRAYKLFKKDPPRCVVGFGSYHSFPVLLAAFLKKIPIVLYEANTTMGKVVKLFSKKAKIVASPFDLHNHLPSFFHVKPLIKDACLMDEHRDDVVSYFALEKNKKTILILGGSQGAHVLNDKILKKLTKEMSPNEIQFIHLAGKNHDLMPIIAQYNVKGFSACVKHFEEKMDLAYQASDLIISRSGATTLFELSYYKKKAILIPFAKSADNHQLMNATFYLKGHMGAMVEEELLDHVELGPLVHRMIDDTTDMFENRSFLSEIELEKKVLELC
jgi:UDP-N-acetylglucosamine--N-acetylmuramyl-(pentapeptide) pyrophosphoryl-undecaprenol N-acetylglucosamine transferase